jgi:hypothetical protein
MWESWVGSRTHRTQSTVTICGIAWWSLCWCCWVSVRIMGKNWIKMLCFSVNVHLALGDAVPNAERRLISDLLKDYDPRARPVKNSSKPLHMSCRLQIRALLELVKDKSWLPCTPPITDAWLFFTERKGRNAGDLLLDDFRELISCFVSIIMDAFWF